MKNVLKFFLLTILGIIGIWYTYMEFKMSFNGYARGYAQATAIKEVYAAEWLNADSFSLKDNKDKVVVLEFWATWCPPCRASIPHLRKMSDKYKDKGVVFASLTDEKDFNMLKRFCSDNNMNWIIGLGSNSGDDYRVRSIPHAFIIADGKIKWRGHPMNGLEKQLEEIVSVRSLR